MLVIPAASSLALGSVEYHPRPSHVQVGAFYMPMPVLVAYLALPRWSREARWLATILESATGTSGFELSRNVLDNVPIQIKNVNMMENSPTTPEPATEAGDPFELQNPKST
jgi:hypothetical protein